VLTASIKRLAYVLVLSLALSACVAESGTAGGAAGDPSTTSAALSTSLATWKNVWTSAPPTLDSEAITYDRDRHVVVVFGGNATPDYGDAYATADIWEWNGARAEWKKRAPVGDAPSLRTMASLVYQPTLKTSLLVGGRDSSGLASDIWEWDGATATWARRTPSGATPSQPFGSATAWDSDRQRVVLFGGWSGSYAGTDNNQTWEWAGGAAGTWTNRTPAVVKIPPRYNATMAYDSVRKKMVVYGGIDNQTWEWDGAAQTWTQGPAAGAGAAQMAFDESRGKSVLLAIDPDWRFVFEYQTTPAPAQWVEIKTAETQGPSFAGVPVYDPDRKVVFFLARDGVWEYDGATGLWAQRPPRGPIGRNFVGLTYDTGAGKLQAFGGRTDLQTFDDFWELSETDDSWNEHPATDPWPPRAGAMVYDSKRDRTMMIVGPDVNNTPITGVWLWKAAASAWTHVATSGVGPTSADVAFYDAARDKFVVIRNAYAAATVIWELDPATFTWTQRPSALAGLPTSFTGRINGGLAYDTDRSKLLFVQGESSAGSVYDSIWEWDAATNTYAERTPLAGQPKPPVRIPPSVSYDSVRHRLVMLSRTDSWEWDPLSGAWTETTSAGQPVGYDTQQQLFDAKNGRTLYVAGLRGPFSLWEYRSTLGAPPPDGGVADGPPIGDGGAPSSVAVTTDHSTYAAGASITVTYSGLPGNQQDWIALAPAGSALTSYVAYVFTNGQRSGTATFTAPAPGTYVARALANNKFDLLGESAAFGVPGVSVDRKSYAPGATMTVTYSGLPGNLQDWIAISPAGSPTTSYVAYVFTNGQKNGTATFTAPKAGTYVARALPSNTFTLLAESASFSVTSVSTDRASYAAGATITVTYSGLPGNPQDWIAIAPAGSATTSYVAYVFTNGQQSGTATFTAPAGGTYVARAFPNNTFDLLTESAAFSITGVSVDRVSYAPGSTITVTYAGLPGNLQDWIAIAPAGSATTSYVAYVFTNGQQSGTATFTAPGAGSYVARAFPNNTFDLIAESAAFSVRSVSVDRTSYAPSSMITVTYSGLPGNLEDWIAIAPAGSPATSYLAYVFTNGQQSGTATFSAPTPGTYVVRAFPNNTFEVIAESPAFGVPGVTVDRTTYAPGSTITVSYSGLPGNLLDWITIAPAGSPTTTYGAYVFTNGQTSGTATFTAPAPGNYVARALPNNTFTLLAESSLFSVSR
jgi:hypothetical protein